jgi:hypothetical protein
MQRINGGIVCEFTDEGGVKIIPVKSKNCRGNDSF